MGVGWGNIANYRVQIEPAIEFRKIVRPLEYQKNVQPVITTQSNTSVADELL